MSVTRISAKLRRLVVSRAEGLCEYCLIHRNDAYFGCEIDHIISEKHDGPTTADNLAFACLFCNRLKGSDIGSIVPETGDLVRFFNPRLDRWSEHFALRDDLRIIPLTEIGVVTERILGFNTGERLLERRALNEEGRYPGPAALNLIRGR